MWWGECALLFCLWKYLAQVAVQWTESTDVMTGHSRKKCLVPFVNVEVLERAETGGFRFQETKKPGVASGDGSRKIRSGGTMGALYAHLFMFYWCRGTRGKHSS